MVDFVDLLGLFQKFFKNPPLIKQKMKEWVEIFVTTHMFGKFYVNAKTLLCAEKDKNWGKDEHLFNLIQDVFKTVVTQLNIIPQYQEEKVTPNPPKRELLTQSLTERLNNMEKLSSQFQINRMTRLDDTKEESKSYDEDDQSSSSPSGNFPSQFDFPDQSMMSQDVHNSESNKHLLPLIPSLISSESENDDEHEISFKKSN